MGLARGDVVTVVLASEFGKPRPAVIVQSDLFATGESVVVIPMTSDLRPHAVLFRKRIDPSAANGLQLASDLMIDKISAISRARVGKTIGRITHEEMAEMTAALALFLGYS
ncbi:MAG: type II toxin-antitoxin system PemK/MazF family toxin [Acidobacteriaceae bacterium]